MGLSKQMTFALSCAVVLAAVLPGAGGYLSARLEAVEAAERNLRAVEARLNARLVRETREHETGGGQARPVSLPPLCVAAPDDDAWSAPAAP